jgi:hypothetical protein
MYLAVTFTPHGRREMIGPKKVYQVNEKVIFALHQAVKAMGGQGR